MAKEYYLVGAARTPFGKFNGSLKDVSAVDLAVIASKAALDRARVPVEEVDNVVFGNVHQSSDKEGILMARHVGLKTGTRIECPALTVNRVCGSGMQAVVSAALSIAYGESEVALVGGAENMSQVPFAIRGARTGLGLGQGKLEDMLWEALMDSFCGYTMAGTAENVGRKYGLRREEVDEFAALSHTRALHAIEAGYFDEEIVPVEVQAPKQSFVVKTDEIPRPTTLETLAKLPPRFIENGLVTAGNASALSDGAAAGVLVSGDYAERHNLNPIGRLVSWAVVGVEPSLMGLGPVAAIRAAFERAGMTLGQMDLIEINEAFAAQFLGCQRELGFDISIANVNGGPLP
ncbi:acetyl-CoA acetyltransferase [Alicyclobacillus acidocaldarius subsp. acidocaldarius Tc-4-1]|uniref:acetyl-CoA C-acetyltransferase n=1 Tax=Alicyclobacillus acidocaldarius (strain Tc-4-1) TaxID=1048834 RepID=F8ICT5_ALIAT|nr:acetyl-CoA acetyltransferase [Alicyclobacillus acidocaldarius subsp. acidocaldarius Tc-4-1]